MYVIGTVGLPGSGKGEFAAVARELDIPVVTMGDVIRDESRERGLDPEQHHGRIARNLREEEGPAAIAERSLSRIRAALEDFDVVLVDGLRSGVEADRFEEAFGSSFLLVSIEAPFEDRAERLQNRGRDDSDLDHDSLRARQERELSFGMGDAMDRADVTVTNDGSLADYHRRVRSILEDPGSAVDDADDRREGDPE